LLFTSTKFIKDQSLIVFETGEGQPNNLVSANQASSWMVGNAEVKRKMALACTCILRLTPKLGYYEILLVI